MALLLTVYGCGSSPLPTPPLARLNPVLELQAPSQSGETPTIRFPAGKPGQITIRIMDREGRQVRQILKDVLAGANEIVWDGNSDDGKPVGNGVYFVVIDYSTGERYAVRVVLAR